VFPCLLAGCGGRPEILQSQVHRESRLEAATDDLGAVDALAVFTRRDCYVTG